MRSALLWLLALDFICSQLVVNVRNKGGEIYKETIEANTTHDTVTLDFKLTDGTLVTQFIDARNELQIFKASILPEEDLGQTEVRNLCFILRFSKHEFISSDAMSKLRQKNPSAIRHPEEESEWELFQMDARVDVRSFAQLSPHIPVVCSEAHENTYSRKSDLELILQILNKNQSLLDTFVTSLPKIGPNDGPCSRVRNYEEPCSCRYDFCVGWYPCGLKYCRGKDSTNKVVNYRCGIKTCSKCRSFEFLIPRHFLCVWNDDVTSFNATEDSFYGGGV